MIDDYQNYLVLLAEWYALRGQDLGLLSDAGPRRSDLRSASADGLRRANGEVHRRYTRMVNFGEGWRRHLWRGDSPRSCSMSFNCTAARVECRETTGTVAVSRDARTNLGQTLRAEAGPQAAIAEIGMASQEPGVPGTQVWRPREPSEPSSSSNLGCADRRGLHSGCLMASTSLVAPHSPQTW